jgi:hypothetical protein
MDDVDKRHKLDEAPFAYRVTNDGRVLLYWHAKQVKTLNGGEARKFLTKIEELEGKDAQLVMAKATGNFKRGNERRKTP